ncbi:MAG: hypothetical protein JWO39_246 [Gemmatimonadetes bacterium]|nr:hypothetical protein [Gemmatimonadota bacterium]
MMPPAASTSPDARADEPPAATFLVRGIFILGMRSLFIVRGTVASGTVRAKQRVIGLPGMDAEVQSVEARLLDVSGGASQTALTFHYTKQAQLERWKSLVLEGSLLSLAAPG